MHRQTFIVVLACMLFAGASQAQSTLTLVDAISSPTQVTIAPGDSFTVTVQLSADVPFVGYSVFLDDPALSGFTIASRISLGTNPFSDETRSNAAIAADPLIDAQSIDLGYTGDDDAAAAGVYDLMQLSITSPASLAAGAYSIRVAASSILADESFVDVFFANTPAPYVINVVVPEPASVLLALPCIIGLLGRGRRHM